MKAGVGERHSAVCLSVWSRRSNRAMTTRSLGALVGGWRGKPLRMLSREEAGSKLRVEKLIHV